jgi:septum site-determining protein MinC
MPSSKIFMNEQPGFSGSKNQSLMPTAAAAKNNNQKPVAFEIKSADLPLVALVLKTHDSHTLESQLLAQFGPLSNSPDFFNDDALVIDYGQLPVGSEDLDLSHVIAVLRQCKLVAVAVRNAPPSSLLEARRLGLVEAHEVYVPAPLAKSSTAAPVVLQKEVPNAVVPVPTMVIDKPIRSGQKIYAKGGDLILLSMVNRGAEVVADGNIHVYAALRGKAMAGAKGNTKARIFALAMEAELVSVAGIYRTAEKPFGSDVLGKPAQIRLSDDNQEKLLIEPLTP